jgi:hypothetical protein
MSKDTASSHRPINLPAIIARYQVLVRDEQHADHVTHATDCLADAVAAFMAQCPVVKNGAIRLLDRYADRELGFVRWDDEATELGLHVPHRQHFFHDASVALVAWALVQRREAEAAEALNAEWRNR